MIEPKQFDIKTLLDSENITYDNQQSTEDRTTEEKQESNSAENSKRIEMERQQSILNSQPPFKRNMITEGRTERTSYYNALKQNGYFG